MKALEVLFWISLFIVFYTYIGYGILLYILVKIKECFRKPAPRPMPADDALPPLTLFIAAYNEEDVVDEKMRNCLELDYPADKLRILWVTDGSNDRYLSMLDSYLSFKEEFPESKYTKEVDRMAKHARDYLDRNKKDEDKDNNI